MTISSKMRVLKDDPDAKFEDGDLEFRLTYAGQLLGSSRNNTRAAHKHEIRKIFHHQMKRLWGTVPHLKQGSRVTKSAFRVTEGHEERTYLVDDIASKYNRFEYSFVPLVTEYLDLMCAVEILFLRLDEPGKLIQGGDIDNRLKTLFDSLRLPKNKDELGGHDSPDESEFPFFVLLEDDSLISKVSVETDTLLEPVKGNDVSTNDVRLVITVRVRPQQLDFDNTQFV